jgi:amylovoran biosynthesis glycosyltransferase AmsB
MPSTGINEHEKISEYLFCNNGYMSTPSFFAKASVFVNNLFDESLIRHQDYELLLRLESCGYQFSFSDHLGVIVHWEDNDTEKKGGTWKYSLDFSKKYKTYFTSKAFTYFILKNVIYPLFIKKQKWLGLKLFIRNCSLLKIGLKDWLFFIDYLFFGKLTIINLFLKLKT